MPLEPQIPNLDTRTFEQILRQAQLRIPRYTPEWTDFNDSDPGMTLVQLFAWLTELMLFEMNRVPERNYLKFLKLLNMELAPARPARAYLTFTAAPGFASNPLVRPRTQVAAQPPDGGEPVIFETEKGLGLIRWPLTEVFVYPEGPETEANDRPGTTFRPLGWSPQVGNALYLGFTPSDPPAADQPFPKQLTFRVFLPPEAHAGRAQACRDATQPPVPPVTLEWEYKVRESPDRWQRLNVYADESAAFTREGTIELEGPGAIVPTLESRIVAQKRYWLRARLAAGSYPPGQEPVLDVIRPNTVSAENLATVREEFVGESTGLPGQVFSLRFRPVQPDTLRLTITEAGQPPQTWKRVDDFLASTADDAHYVLNATSGEIHFGDGDNGSLPVAGAEIVAAEYRHGGGRAGNVGAELINAPRNPPAGVAAVTNARPAVGGSDEQDIQDLSRKAPAVLRHRNRAVTAEDFSTLAARVGGVARATAIPLAHPDHPGIEVPGAVTVVIVPDSPDRRDLAPKPSSDLIRATCSYLDNFRLLTTELFVKGPVYVGIKVEVRLGVAPYASFDTVTRDVQQKLADYLDPLGRREAGPIGPGTNANGSGQPAAIERPRGWDFGKEFYPTSLFGQFLEVEGVEAVYYLAVRANGEACDLTQPVPVPADGLIYGTGDHEIVPVPAADLSPAD